MTFSAIEYVEFANVIVLLLTLAVLVWNLVLMRKQLHDQHEWYRRSKSIEYSSLFHPKVKECRLTLDENFNLFTRDDAIPIDEILEKIRNSRELRLDIHYLLTYYENIAIACRKGIVDEEIVEDMLKGSVTKFKKMLLNYIEARKRETNNQRLWANLIWLANRWEEQDNDTTAKGKLG